MSDDKQGGSAMDSGSGGAKGGQDAPKVKSSTPENAKGEINPAAPGETGTSSKEKQ